LADITVSWKEKDVDKTGKPNHPVTQDKSKWEWVTFPEVDVFDKPHQAASINDLKFERGNRYFVPPEVADELRRIIKTAEKADRRILQGSPDVKSIQESPSGNQGVTFIRST
jgi:hypothetical protein